MEQALEILNVAFWLVYFIAAVVIGGWLVWMAGIWVILTGDEAVKRRKKK